MKASKEQTAKLDRLLKRAEFVRVQDAGRKWIAKGFVVQVADYAPADRVAYGLTVSRKTSVSAVVRNRIRRRLRAAVCDVLPGCAKPGHAFVLIGRREAQERAYDDLKRDLAWCLEKLGVAQT